MGDCVFGNARKLAVSSHESAEAVVTASLARCFETERAFEAAWQVLFSQAGVASRMREASVRPLATDLVVTIRARRGL